MREKSYESKNGVRVFAMENAAQHGFFLSLFVRAGSLYEREEESGITHFLEHITIRNIHHQMGEGLYAMLDKYGLEFNASTYNEMVQFYISGARVHFAKAAEILCRVFSEITLPKSEIDLERLRIKAEIREGDEKNSLAAFTAGVLYPDSSLKNPIVGTLRSVSRVTGRQLETFRKSILTSQNLFFYATGAVGETEISALLSAVEKYPVASGEKRESAPRLPEAFGRRGCAVQIKNADFTMLRFNFDLDMARVGSAELDLLYDLLLSGYGAKFFVEMSEKRGLFYDINGGIDRYKNCGCFYFSFEVKEKNLEESIRIAVEILNDLKTNICKTEDLIKAPYVDNAYLLCDDARELNFTFAYDAHILELPYRGLEDRIAAYRTVTGERMREVARTVFVPENLTLTVKGSKKRLDGAALSAFLCSCFGK